MHFAEGKNVDVVVHQHRAAQLLRDHLAHRKAVPARHDRRRHRHTVPETHRARHTDARAVQPTGHRVLVA
nr:hypothetical protein [Nocardia brasiliensis]